MGECAGDLAVGGLVVDAFDNGFGHWRAARRQRSVAHAHSRGTATSRAVGDNLNLVGDSVLSAHLVGVGAGDFAVGRLTVYTLHAGDWDGRRGLVAGGAAFGGIREVLVAGIDCTRGKL